MGTSGRHDHQGIWGWQPDDLYREWCYGTAAPRSPGAACRECGGSQRSSSNTASAAAVVSPAMKSQKKVGLRVKRKVNKAGARVNASEPKRLKSAMQRPRACAGASARPRL